MKTLIAMFFLVGGFATIQFVAADDQEKGKSQAVAEKNDEELSIRERVSRELDKSMLSPKSKSMILAIIESSISVDDQRASALSKSETSPTMEHRIGELSRGDADNIAILALKVKSHEEQPQTQDLSTNIRYRIGLPCTTIKETDLDKFANPRVKVDKVEAGGPAEKAGLNAGDVVVTVNGLSVKSTWDIWKAVQESGKKNEPIVMQIIRLGELMTIAVKPIKTLRNTPSAAQSNPANPSTIERTQELDRLTRELSRLQSELTSITEGLKDLDK